MSQIIDNNYITKVDRQDQFFGPVDKWQAHKEGILHRAFTAVLVYRDAVLLQKRRHKVFDRTWDLSFSSHQNFVTDHPESDKQAIFKSLKREWLLGTDDVSGEPVNLGTVYYRAEDQQSSYIEHEMDRVYLVRLNKLPEYNPELAYGYDVIGKNQDLYNQLAKYELGPWVKVIINKIDLSNIFTLKSKI